MKQKRKIGLLSLFLVLSMLVFTACGQEKKAANSVIHVGTNAEFPPFEYIDENGEIAGFDVAVMKAIGEEMGYDVEFTNMEFKSLTASLKTGGLDAVAAGMTITEDRKQSVDFSDGYYEATQCIVVSKDSPVTAMKDLEGKKIAVQEGTTGDLMVTPGTDDSVLTDSTVKRFKKGSDAIIELKNGGVDAVVIDKAPAERFVSLNEDSLKCVQDSEASEVYGIAVQKGNTKLLNDINEGLKKIKEKKNLTYVFLIHDLETLRGLFVDDREKFELWDKTMLEIADYIISHNDKMTQYLVDYGIPKDRIFDLEVFDYLYPNENTITYDKSVLLAGNLNPQKSNYISQLKNIKNVNFELYGVNCSDECLADNVNYNGAFPPDDVPAQLTKGFGLVWDGSSVDECTGNTGNYLRYNNPHKLSLYLASGIPVIVWKQSAEAGFVEKYNVGFAVESLNELTDIMSDMTEEKYFDIVKNVKDVSNKVRNGYFLSKSLETIKKL